MIIPAYNCDKFIDKAINSALKQPEVTEVILVNDGSTDNTLKIVETLQKTSKKIKIYHHKNEVNKGRSASRNLGIKNAKGNYIAFLDADDYYLNNRFFNDKKIFESNLDVDGVYNAVGFYFYRDVTPIENENLTINTLSQTIETQDLFDSLISGKYGYLHLNGITLKKSVFKCIGLFNERLIVAEDSDIIFKMAIKCNLLHGNIKTPLAVRGIHDENIFNNEDIYKIYNIKMYESVFIWSGKQKIIINHSDTLLKWIWILKYKQQKSLIHYILYWAFLFFKAPKFIFSYLSIKYFPIIRLRQKLFPFFYK